MAGPLSSVTGDLTKPAEDSPGFEVISGPRGTKLGFAIFAKDSLRASDYLFNTIGESKTNPVGTSTNYLVISSTIRITGVTTGYRIEIPVVYAKTTT